MRLFGCLVFALGFASAWCQQHTFPGKFLEQPPAIDGVVGEEEWRDVPSESGGFDEQTGAPDPFGARYWIAYDRTYIYIAGRMTDPNPAQIQATEYRQNVSLDGNDLMIFAIDPFSSLGDMNQFEVNPRGATNIRIAGGRAAKREWLGEFLAKGRITDTGWEAEARIPWSILRLPPPGVRDLRITFGRVINRTGRAYVLDDLSGGKSHNFGLWKQVDVPKAAVSRSVKLLPYVYGGLDQDGAIANAGLDLKAPITGGLDLVGSINPDFRNIENEVLSLDFSYFERLAGESRPFFLEGSSYFSTSQDAPLFASQRISGFDFGGKVYGKLTENSTLGLLNTVDLGNQNSLVGAFKYNFSTKTNATLAMSDLETPTLSNRASFVSISHEVGPLSFFGQHMLTSDTEEGDGHRYNTGFVFNQSGLTSVLEYVEISPKFLPRLGFAPERNFKGMNGFVEYDAQVRAGSLMEVGGSMYFSDLVTFGNEKYRRAFGTGGSLTMRDGTDIDVELHYEEFEGFVDRVASISIERPRDDPYRNAQIGFAAGTIAGHSYRSFRPSLRLRPLRNLQIAASFQRVEHFDIRQRTILSANYDINANDAISGRAIRTGSDTNFYLAYRRTGNTGNEYFLILGDPNAQTFRMSLVIKAVFPLEFRF